MAKTSNTDRGIPANTRRAFCECDVPRPEFAGENTYTNCLQCGRGGRQRAGSRWTFRRRFKLDRWAYVGLTV
jgi:hypothetical protein